MDQSLVTLSCIDSVAHLVLSSPPKNEMGTGLFAELSRLVEKLGGLRVRGLVVCGQGRHFSSGADLAELRAMFARGESPEAARALLDNSNSLSALASLPYPTVAAIRGCCLGSGLELALACRFRIACRTAVLGLPEATFGFMPGCGGTMRLTKLVGYRKAIELIVSGSSLLAPDALAVGLVDAVVDKEELEETAFKFIERLG